MQTRCQRRLVVPPAIGTVRFCANAARNSCQRENLARSWAAAEGAYPQISLVGALPLRRYDGNSGFKSWCKSISTRENMFHCRRGRSRTAPQTKTPQTPVRVVGRPSNSPPPELLSSRLGCFVKLVNSTCVLKGVTAQCVAGSLCRFLPFA